MTRAARPQYTDTAAEHLRRLRRQAARARLRLLVHRPGRDAGSPLLRALRHAWLSLVCVAAAGATLAVLPTVLVLDASAPAAADTHAVAHADEALHDRVHTLTEAHRCDPVSPARAPAQWPAAAVEVDRTTGALVVVAVPAAEITLRPVGGAR